MATVQIPGPVFQIAATNDYKITGASDEGMAGGVLVHIVNDGGFVGTITVKGQSHQLEISGATDSFQPIPYKSINVNGTVGTGAFVSTGITTHSIIFIQCNGMTPVLSVAWTSGTAHVYVTPIIGASSF